MEAYAPGTSLPTARTEVISSSIVVIAFYTGAGLCPGSVPIH
jgi:hypothetical protein